MVVEKVCIVHKCINIGKEVLEDCLVAYFKHRLWTANSSRVEYKDVNNDTFDFKLVPKFRDIGLISNINKATLR